MRMFYGPFVIANRLQIAGNLFTRKIVTRAWAKKRFIVLIKIVIPHLYNGHI
jgi:hypothetical protein